MKQGSFLKIAIASFMVLFFSSEVLGDMLGNWEDTWDQRERPFNNYMKKDYLQAKKAIVKHAKANKPEEEYRREESEYTDLKTLYKLIQGKSRLIGTYLRTIDRDYRNKDLSDSDKIETFTRFFLAEIKKFKAAKKDYLRLMNDLKEKENIDLKKIKLPTKALKHISKNLTAEYKMIKNMPTESTVEAIEESTRKSLVSNMANSIAQAKYAIAKVKNKPTVATWTKKNLMQKACRDVQMAIGGFTRYELDFDDADELKKAFTRVYEKEMIKFIKSNIRGGGDEEEEVMDAIKIIEKDLKRVDKSFKKYKRSL
jgi:hypothetical protein